MGEGVDEGEVEGEVDEAVPVVDGGAVAGEEVGLALGEVEGEPVEPAVDDEGEEQVDDAGEGEEGEEREVGVAAAQGRDGEAQQQVGQQPHPDAARHGHAEQQVLVEGGLRGVEVVQLSLIHI